MENCLEAKKKKKTTNRNLCSYNSNRNAISSTFWIFKWTTASQAIKPRTMNTQRELFSKIPNFWAWACKFRVKIHRGIWGILSELSAPILALCVPCPCFPLIKHYFYKKLSLCKVYIHIPNIYLGLGFEFEFGLKRVRSPWSSLSWKKFTSSFYLPKCINNDLCGPPHSSSDIVG